MVVWIAVVLVAAAVKMVEVLVHSRTIYDCSSEGRPCRHPEPLCLPLVIATKQKGGVREKPWVWKQDRELQPPPLRRHYLFALKIAVALTLQRGSRLQKHWALQIPLSGHSGPIQGAAALLSLWRGQQTPR